MRPPLRFLFGVGLAWLTLRVALLWPTSEAPFRRPGIAWAPPLPAVRLAAGAAPRHALARSGREAAVRRGPRPVAVVPVAMDGSSAPQPPVVAAAPAAAAAAPGVRVAPSVRTSLRISAWLLVRPERRSLGAAPAGELGGSQAGVRASLPVTSGLALTARLSAPLHGRAGREAAAGFDWRPLAALPLTLAGERRFRAGARDGWAAYAYGGVSGARIAGSVALDGYAQAGVSGGRTTSGFVDGAATVTAPIDRTLRGGAGVWAGAQPGAARLDIGPTIAARFGGARLSIDWRLRVAGDARPRSGPAVTLAADF